MENFIFIVVGILLFGVFAGVFALIIPIGLVLSERFAFSIYDRYLNWVFRVFRGKN